MKLQVDIPKELNQKLKIYKIKNNLVSIQEALIDILYKFFNSGKGKLD